MPEKTFEAIKIFERFGLSLLDTWIHVKLPWLHTSLDAQDTERSRREREKNNTTVKTYKRCVV